MSTDDRLWQRIARDPDQKQRVVKLHRQHPDWSLMACDIVAGYQRGADQADGFKELARTLLGESPKGSRKLVTQVGIKPEDKGI